MPKMPDGKCFNCGTETDGDHYCYGCKSYICDECEAGYSVAAAGMGRHAPEDHFTEAEAEEDD